MTTSEQAKHVSVLKTLVPIIIIIAVVIASLSFLKLKLGQNNKLQGKASDAHASFSLNIGSNLENFEWVQLNAPKDVKKMASDIEGKVILVNFWATWCEACIVEMPSIVKLYTKYHEKGFNVLGINVDENPEVVAPKVIEELKIPFIIAVDPESKLGELFDVHAIPMTFIYKVDAAGNRTVLMKDNGERDWFDTEIQEKMDKWLNSPSS